MVSQRAAPEPETYIAARHPEAEVQYLHAASWMPLLFIIYYCGITVVMQAAATAYNNNSAQYGWYRCTAVRLRPGYLVLLYLVLVRRM
jgi:hypothetical protein